MINTNRIKILKAEIKDAESIQALTVESSNGMYSLCGWSKKEINNHFNPEKVKEGSERLRNCIPTFTNNDVLLVAKNMNDKIIGYCFATKEKSENRIEAVYLTEEYQGTGLAKKLFDAASELLDPKNETYLDVFSLNSKAINFYRKLGFYETGKKHLDERFQNSKGERLEITEMILDKK
jgi:ribosomal protein S18 acetylase RimI-like enzyme